MDRCLWPRACCPARSAPPPRGTGNMMRNGAEQLPLDEFAKLLTCATSELRNRPAVGLSVFCGAL